MTEGNGQRSFRMAVVEVLIDHAMELDRRRQQRTETTWPDESDIYTGTTARLRVLFKKKLQAFLIKELRCVVRGSVEMDDPCTAEPGDPADLL